MGVLIKLVIVAFAIFPAAVLTAFLVSHYRRRIGLRLVVRTLVLGVMSGLLVLAVGPIIRWATDWAMPGVERALVTAFLGRRALKNS